MKIIITVATSRFAMSIITDLNNIAKNINCNITQCLKITEKSHSIVASEASYVYILNGQKFIENAKNDQFGDFLQMQHFW